MSRFQDVESLPTPATKQKKGLWMILAGLGGILLMIVLIKAGKSTKDPKKAISEAAKTARTEMGEETSRSAQSAAGAIVGSDGALRSQGDSTEKEIREKIEKNLEAANRARLDAERDAFRKRVEEIKRREGLPESLDEQGRPRQIVETAPTSQVAEVRTTAPGKQPAQPQIPGFAEGWNPEQDIIVPGTEGLPAYRYIPAYLKGSNQPSRMKDLEDLDTRWLNSIAKPSYGASKGTNGEFNQGIPAGMSVGRQVTNSRGVRVQDLPGVRQPTERTPRDCPPEMGSRKRRTIPAEGGER